MDSASTPPASRSAGPPQASATRRQRLKLIAILLVCLSPVVASYLAYYVFPPQGRTNYGTLIEPQRPVPELALTTLDGEPYRFSSLLGQWVLLHVDSGACDAACARKLFELRQQRTMTGKNRDRLERVWLVTDGATPPAALLREHDGTIVARVDRARLDALLPVEPGRRVEDYLWVVDPIGNLMMRFPADGDPDRVKKDIGRLLRASRIG